jgi:MscS family membrane protein
MMSNSAYRLAVCLGILIFFTKADAQLANPASAPASAQPDTRTDVLGRTTPRGTVLGFLRAGAKGDNEVAAEYLNTRVGGAKAALLAHQLFVVLDRRLPARLNEVSDRREGSLTFLTRPDVDLVGTIDDGEDKLDILVEKVSGENGPIWLFSKTTLESVPELFDAVNTISVERVLPEYLVRTQIAHIALFEWLGVFVGLPLLYALTGLLRRGLNSLIGNLRRRLYKKPDLPHIQLIPTPARLLLVAFIIRWILSGITLPLLGRQFWSGTAAAITITSCVWLFMLLTARYESSIQRRFERVNNNGATAVLRLGRRTIDLLAIFVGVVIVLRYFGIQPTAALAGLGVGGIAVALAAQKTLENVIGGISIIFDKAVRVGDMLNTGSTMGVIESVGLRSTRIRTLDRSLVSVPNGQLANIQIENLSIRDKFWFHHNLSLRYETTVEMIRSIVEEVSELLMQHRLVENSSVRVRFIRLGTSSLDIEVFAYVLGRDWAHFLQVQEDLLLRIMTIVEAAGAHLAFPSQTLYLGTDQVSGGDGTPRYLQAPTDEETRSALH